MSCELLLILQIATMLCDGDYGDGISCCYLIAKIKANRPSAITAQDEDALVVLFLYNIYIIL